MKREFSSIIPISNDLSNHKMFDWLNDKRTEINESLGIPKGVLIGIDMSMGRDYQADIVLNLEKKLDAKKCIKEK